MSLDDDNTGDLFTEPISIGDLLKNGAHFQINTDFESKDLPDELFDDWIKAGSDDDDDDEKRNIKISPWEKSFDELRQQMTKVNDLIYKKITKEGNPEYGICPENARVIIQYNAYGELETEPFDSSFMRGENFTFYLGKGVVLSGLELAVATMLKGEEAQFVISYELLFGEMGCPPRIKPKADGLFIVSLLNFTVVGDENAMETVSAEDRNKFLIVFPKAKEVYLKGLDFFKQGKTPPAVRSFHKAVTALEFCRLSNEQEQKEQREFLVKLYVNLAVCYNKMNLPSKACCMCNEIKKISNINQNCKALFHEGRALLMIGEFGGARSKLVQAQRVEPNNPEITKELKKLSQKYNDYNENQKTVWKRAMGIVNETKGTKEEHIDKFKTEVHTFLKEFKEKNNVQQLSLPEGLTSDEVNCVEELANELGLKMSINDVYDKKHYLITKNT